MTATDHETESRRCIVCRRRELTATELQTCAPCVGRTRTAILDIVQLYALLPEELTERAGTARPLDAGPRGGDTTMPGGDVLILAAGGSDGANQARAILREQNADHAEDEHPGDVPSVLATLTSWEDDWRKTLDIAPAGWRDDTRGRGDHRYPRPTTVAEATGFLQSALAHMAQRHDAFDDFAHAMQQLRGHLERALRAGDPIERAAVHCPDCGGELRREYRRPDPCPDVWVPPRDPLGYGIHFDYGILPGYWAPCPHAGDGHDQGGRRDHWHCRDRRCGRLVEPAEYWLAVRQLMLERQDAAS